MRKSNHLSERMRGVCLLPFIILLACSSRKQLELKPYPVSDCISAIPMLYEGDYKFSFLGNNGEVEEWSAYPSLEDWKPKNTMWYYFTAPFSGIFSIQIHSDMKEMGFIVFQAGYKEDVCSTIMKGRAEIKRWVKATKESDLGLKDTVEAGGYLVPLEIEKGNSIMIAFTSESKRKGDVQFNIKFEPKGTQNLVGTGMHQQLVVDRRRDELEMCMEINVRDIESLLPVTALVEIEYERQGIQRFKASDAFIPIAESGRINVRCFAQGYFLVDRTETVEKGKYKIINLWLEQLSFGKTIVLDDIQFVPGTSDFLPSSGPKLQRLKDFMYLNPDVKIEIRGHVLEVGKSTQAGLSLSEGRAKRVMQYLEDSGIESKRMKAVGLGGTEPIFANPTTSAQEQLNRRVEIVVY